MPTSPVRRILAQPELPYLASFMADNDLALWRIVEFLSHTPYWEDMAIIVTQPDAGGEPDHVDAQRSILMIIMDDPDDMERTLRREAKETKPK